MSRFPMILAAMAALVAGLVAGEARLGWALPVSLVHLHGPLMVCGFFGTVIAIERAVALNRPWAFAAPIATGAGGLLLISGAESAGATLLTLGSLLFVGLAALVLRRQWAAFTGLLVMGALFWLAGNALWLSGADIPSVIPFWASFLILTIAGERLELSRFLKPSPWRLPTLLLPLILVAAGSVVAAAALPYAWTIFGAGCVALVGWSWFNDIARRTVLNPGLSRYVGVALLSAYAWLGVAGFIFPMLDQGLDSYTYDAALHAVFVGFVFAMVFGHAPVVLPAVAGLRLPFTLAFYIPLALLHLSLILRVTGDLSALDSLRMWGGLLNGGAVIAFVAVVAGTAIKANKPQRGIVTIS